MMRFYGGCLFAMALVFAGCRDETAGVAPPAINEAHRQIVDRSNQLALELYSDLRTKPGNVAIAPYGASVALAMLLPGADGTTRQQLLGLLAVSAHEVHHFHAAQGDLLRWLNAADDSRPHRLDIAAALFTQSDHDPLLAFVKLLETHYACRPYLVDFVSQPATARKVINDWAAEKTRDRIRDIVSPEEVSPQTRVVLASAVYFKGDWERPFETSLTTEQPFHFSREKKSKVPMMSQIGEFAFAHVDNLRVLLMPYHGGELCMALLLPDDVEGLGAVEERLSGAELTRWLAAAEKHVVELPVSIPRFTFDDKSDLEATLKRLGMLTAFDPTAADLSRIDGIRPTAANAGDRLFVDRVRQRVMIEVNEEGTEAAAVTTIGAAKGEEASDAERPRFQADHPFLFLVRENATGLILFLGRVADPSKK